MTFQQSVVIPIMKPDSIELGDFLDTIKSIGFHAVEIWGRDNDFEELMEAVHQRGLRIASMVGHTHACPIKGSHAEGFSRRENHDRLEVEMRESIDIATRHGIPGLITLSGHRNPGESDQEGLQICAEGLRRIAPYAEEKGINLNMELLNSKIDHPHYLCDRVDWAIDLCKALNSPRVKVLFDIYHVAIMEGDIIRNLRKAATWIGHYHTAGNPGRQDLDDSQEINYAGVCRSIQATNYNLYLGHEFRPKKDLVHALSHAYSVCKPI